MRIRGLSLVTMAILPIFLAGCNAQDASNLTHDVGRMAKDTGAAAGNAELVARINATLAERKGVDMSGLHITAQAGIVTVSGHVRTQDEKKKVLETVNDIRGVDKTVDDLHVQRR